MTGWAGRPCGAVGREIAGERCRYRNHLSRPVHTGDGTLGGAQELSAGDVNQLIRMIDAHMRLPDDFCFQCQFVVVPRRFAECRADPHHHEENTLFFQIAVTHSGLAQQFRAPHFKIGQVMRMMQIAHRVAFDIAHAKGNGTFRIHE